MNSSTTNSHHKHSAEDPVAVEDGTATHGHPSPVSSTEDLSDDTKAMLSKMSPNQLRFYYFFEVPTGIVVRMDGRCALA